MSHTPTPWRSTKNEAESPEYERILIETQSNVIAEVVHADMEWEEYEDNAELIVKAVNSYQAMKEALEKVIKELRHVRDNDYDNWVKVLTPELMDAWTQVTRALTLANGKDKEP